METGLNIQDHEIEDAERLLLPQGETFDEQRRAVIRCLSTVDIQACPGSGKTTALLAKLLILSRKLPLKSNKGLCVLTHTNVAVEEIRGRLKGETGILFQYPNHFGTIQSFVNKFLAIPAYIDMFGKRPTRIDDESYNEYTSRKVRQLPYGTKLWLERNRVSVCDLRHTLDDVGIIGKTIHGPIFLGAHTETYQRIKRLKDDVMNEGILCYDDAYVLATWYLRKYPEIKEVFSERFQFVFIDEMQDTNNTQQCILNLIFDYTKLAVQKIGDTNQSIFESTSDMAWQVSEGCLQITNSKRFSQVIAQRVKNICITPQDLRGNDSIPDIPPKLIVFEDSSILGVIPKFGDLILDNGLEGVGRRIYKAVGWVGQLNAHHTIPSYFPSYDLQVRRGNKEFNYLKDYLLATREYTDNDSISELRMLLVSGILKTVRLLGIKKHNGTHYVESSFFDYLRKDHGELCEKIKLKILQWCDQLYRSEDIFDDVKDFIVTELTAQLGTVINLDTQTFLDGQASPELQHEEKLNIFIHQRRDIQVNIQVSNVHRVKRETHTATLYLETFYRKYDIKAIVNYMKGIYTLPGTATLRNSLKMAYVGMTRPTHMLCVAAHKDSCEDHLQDLVRAGWEVHRV